MKPWVTIDLQAGVPPYEQIRTQIAGLIRAGVLAPGSHLPTGRALAADLGVAQNTIARAYRALSDDNLVEVRRRTGTVVLETPTPSSQKLIKIVDDLIREARAVGLADAQLLDLVQGFLAKHQQGAGRDLQPPAWQPSTRRSTTAPPLLSPVSD